MTRTEEPRATVHAPAAGIRLQLEQACVGFEIYALGLPVPRAQVSVRFDEPSVTDVEGSSFAMGESRSMADEAGRFFLHCAPTYGAHVRAWDGGLGEAKLFLATQDLALGGLHALLLTGETVETATLVVHFDGDSEALGLFHAGQIEAYDLAAWSEADVDAVLDKTLPGEAKSLPSEGRSLYLESQGNFEETWNSWTFRHLKPGRYLVCIRRSIARAGPQGYALGTAFVVELGEGQEVHERWHAEPGGRLRLEVTASGEGAAELFSARIHDRRGEELPIQFHDPRGEGLFRSSLTGTGIFEVIPALPPGEYTLELRLRGLGTRTVGFRVDAGATTDVHVDLSDL